MLQLARMLLAAVGESKEWRCAVFILSSVCKRLLSMETRVPAPRGQERKPWNHECGPAREVLSWSWAALACFFYCRSECNSYKPSSSPALPPHYPPPPSCFRCGRMLSFLVVVVVCVCVCERERERGCVRACVRVCEREDRGGGGGGGGRAVRRNKTKKNR